MNTRTEPAMMAGTAAAALIALLVVYGVVTEVQGAAWGGLALALIPLVQAWWTRQRVMPTDTIREAGVDPARLKDRASNPGVSRNTEGEG